MFDSYNRRFQATFVFCFFFLVFAYYFLYVTPLAAIDAQRLLLVSYSFFSFLFLLRSAWIEICLLLGLGAVFFVDLPYLAGVKQVGYWLALLPIFCFFCFGWRYISPLILAVSLSLSVVVSALLITSCSFIFIQAGVGNFWLDCFPFSTHPRFFNHFQVAAFLPILYMTFAKGGGARWYFIGALVLLFYVAFISAGRGFWVTSAVGLALYVSLVDSRDSRKAIVISLACVLTAFAITQVLSLGSNLEQGVGLVGRDSVLADNRSHIWRVTFLQLLDRPIFGYGAYSYSVSGNIPPHLPAHPHQHFLQVAYEWGLLSAFVLYGVILAVGLVGLNLVRRSGDQFSVVLLISAFLLLINAQYSAVLSMPLGQFMLLLYLGLLVARLHSLGLIPIHSSGGCLICARCSPIVSRLIVCIVCGSQIYWAAVCVDYVKYKYGGVARLNFIHEEKVRLLPRTWENGT